MPQAPKPPCGFTGVDRVVAVGDLHGNYPGLRRILAETGLIDGQGHWKARRTHLVLIGDVLGRGGEPGKIFSLLRRLEAEAPARASRVHLLLGNHEAMSIRGMLRYNTLEEFQDLAAGGFGGDGPACENDPASEDGLRWETESGAPTHGLDPKLGKRLDMLGAREFRMALAPGGAVGAWLLEHDSAVAINGHLFVHGGLNRAHGHMPLEELNARVRAELAGAEDGGSLLRRDGPQWNRDYALDPAAGRREELEDVLKYHGCRRMVVGHTPTSCIASAQAGRIVPMYGGKLFCIDTGIGRAYGGRLSALEIEGRAPESLYFA